MTEWKIVKLSELGEIVGGATPSTSREDYYNGDIAWITPKDLAGYKSRYISCGERNITQAGLNSCSAKIMPKYTILFSSRAPIGYTAIAENDICTNQGFKSIVPNEYTNYLFLYYLLEYNKNMIASLGSGTTFKEVSGTTMRNIEVSVPVSIEIQRKIAAILDSIDSKIELNNRINDNLEQQALSVFQKNLIEIEDVSETWTKGSLLDIADYLNGLAMQKYRPTAKEVGLPVLKIKELRQGFCDTNSELCSPAIKSEYIINDGDVIFSWSGSLLVDIWCGGTCGLNQHLFKVTSKNYDKWFYYLWTKHHLDKFVAIAAAKATTMGHIKREDLAKAEVIIPSKTDYEKIGSVLQPIIDLIIANNIENRKLIALRDELLPKLMSGEIDVEELGI